MRKIFCKEIIMGVSFAALTACGAAISPAEKESRQNLAFNIAGRYSEISTPGSGMTVQIADESGFYDLKVALQMNRRLNSGERAQIQSCLFKNTPQLSSDEIQMAIAEFETAVQNLTLGDGIQHEERGGENVVLDARGALSEAVVDSARSEIFSKVIGRSVQKIFLRATLYFTAYANSSLLDYAVTRNTDYEGRSSTDTKGLVVSLYNENLASPSSADRICDIAMDVKPLGKYYLP